MATAQFQCPHQAKCSDGECPHREKHKAMVGKEEGFNSCDTTCSNGLQFSTKVHCKKV